MGGTPYSFLSSTSSPRDASPPIRFSGGFSKTRCTPSLSLIPHCSAQLFSMVNSLEALVLYTVPLAVLFDLLQAAWHLPLRKACVNALFQRSTTDELTRLSRTLPWDYPIARTWIAKSIVAKWPVIHAIFLLPGLGSIPFLILFFFYWFVAVFPDLDFRRTVLWPIHLCLCPRRRRLN